MAGAGQECSDHARSNLEVPSGKISEISESREIMYRKFAAEHGLTLAVPMSFSIEKYRRELDKIEDVYSKQFGTTTLLMTSRLWTASLAFGGRLM